ncbi:MAG: LCP family protein [Gracilibacteraceae bacterium]|nr:LCP family protein [Gracilibacteraceae bacterium]
MKKYIIIFLASFLVFFIIIGGIYYKYKSNMTDEHFVKIIEENPELEPEDAKEEVIINTLFMGIDEARSDTMIVISYNKINQKIALLSIPRDTRVEIPGYGVDKINAAAAKKEGTALAMRTVSNLLGIPIHHYVKVTFKGAERIIDILGGVTVNVPPGMDYEDPVQDLYIHLKPGLQVLNGKDAVKFARFRSGYPDQDLGRIRAQQQLIKAFIDKLTSPKMIPKALTIADAMSKCIKTNLDSSDIAHYAMNIKDIKMENISFHTLPGNDGYINKISYFLHDETKLKEMMEQIRIDLGVQEQTEETELSPANNDNIPEVSETDASYMLSAKHLLTEGCICFQFQRKWRIGPSNS